MSVIPAKAGIQDVRCAAMPIQAAELDSGWRRNDAGAQSFATAARTSSTLRSSDSTTGALPWR